jgi:hypothetical protein
MLPLPLVRLRPCRLATLITYTWLTLNSWPANSEFSVTSPRKNTRRPDYLRSTPVRKPARSLVVGPARVLVSDIGRKEFPEPSRPVATLVAGAQSMRTAWSTYLSGKPLAHTVPEKFDQIPIISPRQRESLWPNGRCIDALCRGKAMFRPNVLTRMKNKRLAGGADWIRTGVAFRHTFALFRPEKSRLWRKAQTENHDAGESEQTARRADEIRTDGRFAPHHVGLGGPNILFPPLARTSPR